MNMKKMKKFFTLSWRAEGFTLVELIVVIAILAILGGVAVPAYGGYVKKADRAADEALLNEINTAFASACSLNGVNYFMREDTDLVFDGKKVKELKISDGQVKTDFGVLFESEEVEFKAINVKDIMYVKAEGRFREAQMKPFTKNGKTYYVSEKYQDMFVNSTWTEDFTVAELMAAIDGAVNFAAVNAEKLSGITGSDEFKELYKGLYGEYPPENPDEKQVMNAMVLYVAQNTENLDTGYAYDTIVNNKGSLYLDGDDTEDVTLTAMQYAAGMAWAKETMTEEEYNELMSDPEKLIDAMGPQPEYDEDGFKTGNMVDSDFVKWMEENPDTAKDAMNGYAGALGIVGDNTENVKGEELAGGFAESDTYKDLITDVQTEGKQS